MDRTSRRAGLCSRGAGRTLELAHRARAWGVARWAVPPATLAAVLAFAAHDAWPSAAAEGPYLGALAAAVLLTVAALAPPPAVELGIGAVLAATAVWLVPPGPARGAALALALAAALCVAAVRRLGPELSPGGPADELGEQRTPCTRSPLPLSTILPLVLGCQLLLRCELLLGPGRDFRPWAALIALPLAGSFALSSLARSQGVGAALLAGATALLLPGTGLTVASTLALAALAAAGAASSLSISAPDTSAPGGRRGRVLAARAAALAVLLLPVIWQPRAGWVAILAALTLWRADLALELGLPLAAAYGALGWLGWLDRLPHSSPPAPLGTLGPLPAGAAALVWLILLLPAFPLARRTRLVAAAFALAFVTPWARDSSALAAPLALAALALAAPAAPRAGASWRERLRAAALGVQAVWTATLLAGTVLLACYPWLRSAPLADAVSLLGRAASPPLAAVVLAATLALAAGGGWLARPPEAGPPARRVAGARPAPPAVRSRFSPAGGSASAAGAVLFLALLWPLLGSSLPLLGGSVRVLLDRAHPVWQVNLGPPQRAAYLVVESSLSHAADLAAGTAAATVRLVAAGGRSASWTLRAGDETGEWAARRPDVAQAASLSSPPAWSSWVAGDFFGQLYRGRWRLPWSGPFEILRVELAPGLPPDTALALHALELER